MPCTWRAVNTAAMQAAFTVFRQALVRPVWQAVAMTIGQASFKIVWQTILVTP